MDSAALMAAGVAVTFGVWWLVSEPQPSQPVSPAPILESTIAQELVTVHVSGAVERPGVVRLSSDARAIDAVEAAGGASPDADLSQVNLAAAVVDGSQIQVPRLGEHPASATGAAGGMLAVNRADAAALEALPGVGPVLAARIVSHREAHGPYRTPEDLLDVSGIGESILARLRPHIQVP
ncbi:MAG: ComEA family DNA-binding protein [Acidimicrobiia bacterium]|nr:ComEA family DNA-binding protein [Acidimicrobiia bacterium]